MAVPVTISFQAPEHMFIMPTGGPHLQMTGVVPERVSIQNNGVQKDALFLSPEEAKVLAKMAVYSLQRLKVSDEARTILTDLLPRLEELTTGGGGDSVQSGRASR